MVWRPGSSVYVCARVYTYIVSSVSLIAFFCPTLPNPPLYFHPFFLFLFHLWLPLISLSFVFLNSPPPLASSSLLLPLFVSYIISFFCLLTHDFTWQTQVAISLFKGKQSSLSFSRDSSGPCCIRCIVWFPPPGLEQLPQDMLIICHTASDGLLSLTNTHARAHKSSYLTREWHDWQNLKTKLFLILERQFKLCGLQACNESLASSPYWLLLFWAFDVCYFARFISQKKFSSNTYR